MEEPITLSLDYRLEEAVQASRMRYRHSRQVRWLLLAGVLTVVGLRAYDYYLYFKWYAPLPPWTNSAIVLLTILVVFFGIYLFAPALDFRMGPGWKLVYTLRLYDDGFSAAVENAPLVYEMTWERIQRVLEDDKVYVLMYGREQDFFVLPKRVLQPCEDYFRSRLPPGLLVMKG